jgi:DNA-binding response OmpR family regulator
MSRPPRSLVVEDEELLAAVIADVLGESHVVICASNVGDAMDHLLGDDIDFVLLIACCRTGRTGRSLSNLIGGTSGDDSADLVVAFAVLR